MKIFLLLFLVLPSVLADKKINVCATTPNIASIVRAIGGAAVDVKSIITGEENPYVLKDQHRAVELINMSELLVVNGFGLEDKWLPELLSKSSNKNVSPGQTGYFDPSIAIKPLVYSKGAFTRLSGRGEVKVNPHYLFDPVNAMLISQLVCSRLKNLNPKKMGLFNKNLATFQGEVFSRLVGAEISKDYSPQKLARAIKRNQFMKLIEDLSARPNVKGWFGKMRNFSKKKVVVDRNTYKYFLKRFGIKVILSAELFPGQVPPLFHLQKIKKELTSGTADCVLRTSWFNEEYIKELLAATKTSVIELVGHAEEGLGSSYVKLMDLNINKLLGLTRKTTE